MEWLRGQERAPRSRGGGAARKDRLSPNPVGHLTPSFQAHFLVSRMLHLVAGTIICSIHPFCLVDGLFHF